MKKILALDFDDVVADSSIAFARFLNRHYKTHLVMEQMMHFEFEKIWNVSRQEINDRWMEFEASDMHENILPLAGAVGMIQRLRAAYDELHTITNRPWNQRDSTERFIAKHLPTVFAGLHFCSHPATLRTYRTKSSVCKYLGANILLEDHPKNVAICAADGVHVYLFEQPWNQNHQFPFWEYSGTIVPVKNWQDPILETLFR